MSKDLEIGSGTVSDTIPVVESVPDDYADFIINLRKEYGFPQCGLAKRLGVSKSSVYRWENNISRPPLSKWKVLQKIHNADNFFDRYVCVFDAEWQKEMLIKDFYNKLYPVLAKNGITPDKIRKIVTYGHNKILDGEDIDIDDIVKLLVKIGYKMTISVEPI